MAISNTLSNAQVNATLDRLMERFKLIDIDRAPGRVDLASVDLAACTAPEDITRAEFDKAFQFGYFVGWFTMGDHESFRCPEPYAGSVHMTWVRVGDRCFKLRRPLHETHTEILARVMQKMRTETVATLFN